MKSKDKKHEGLNVSDLECYDCGKNLIQKNKEYLFDKDINERITICPECWDIRKQINRDIGVDKKEFKPIIKEVNEKKHKKNS